MKTIAKTLALLAVTAMLPGEARGQDGTELDTILDRAASYVDAYEEELGMIVGEEEYVQNATWMSRSARPPVVVGRERRRLQSDFLLLPVEDRWYGVRSVLRVDGNPVDEPDTFPESPREIVENRTDTAYNIGDFTRTFNVPTFALTVLRRDNVGRFSFERRGGDRIEDHETWEIRFSEVVTPTLVRGAGGEDRFATGRVWIAPESGKILRTQIVIDVRTGGEPYRATQRVQYEENPVLGILVPASMEERYDSEFHTVEARADYSDFQRFRVQVDQAPGTIIP